MATSRDVASAADKRFLDGYLPFLLARASYLISAEFHRQLAAKNIRVSVWRLLGTLQGTNGMTISELADAMLLQQPTVTKIVDRIESAGLVERRSSASDRRQVIVDLTRRGRTVVRSLIKEAEEHQDRILAGFSKAETDLLFRVLRDVLKRVGAEAWGASALAAELRGRQAVEKV